MEEVTTAEFVRTIRHALGLTQRLLAGRMGVDISTVKAWERGRREPSGPALVLLEQLRQEAVREGEGE